MSKARRSLPQSLLQSLFKVYSNFAAAPTQLHQPNLFKFIRIKIRFIELHSIYELILFRIKL